MSLFLLGAIFFLVLLIGYAIGKNEMKQNAVSSSYMVMFDTRAQAESVLSAMRKYISEHDFITVRYVAQNLTGATQAAQQCTGYGMGWSTLEGAMLVRDQFDLWWLCLPNPYLQVKDA